MPNQSITLEDFIFSKIRTVQSKRTYLLDKPCTRCHHSTNLRVHLPTCSHRICSACLAGFESSHQTHGPIACPTCSTYWFTLPSDLEIGKRSKVSESQSPEEKNMPTRSIGSLWPPQTSTSSHKTSAKPQPLDYDGLDGSDGGSTGTVSDASREDLDLQILRVQGQRSQTAFDQIKEVENESVAQLEATETQTSCFSMARNASQSQGQPQTVHHDAVADASLVEVPPSEVASPAVRKSMNTAHTLAIYFVIVCLVFELASDLIFHTTSALSMRK
ncbi:hypothetical protein PSPO01_05187 [Paraphaeosphaeria sporulosa]